MWFCGKWHPYFRGGVKGSGDVVLRPPSFRDVLEVDILHLVSEAACSREIEIVTASRIASKMVECDVAVFAPLPPLPEGLRFLGGGFLAPAFGG